METFAALSALFGGVLIRIAVPVLITGVLVYLFTRLDAKWKSEAEKATPISKGSPVFARNTGCWNINGCSEEKKKTCRAYANPDTPCWQVFRTKEGLLQENCLGCQVFKDAPLPVHA